MMNLRLSKEAQKALVDEVNNAPFENGKVKFDRITIRQLPASSDWGSRPSVELGFGFRGVDVFWMTIENADFNAGQVVTVTGIEGGMMGYEVTKA
jgi:hypothetical protein